MMNQEMSWVTSLASNSGSNVCFRFHGSFL